MLARRSLIALTAAVLLCGLITAKAAPQVVAEIERPGPFFLFDERYHPAEGIPVGFLDRIREIAPPTVDVDGRPVRAHIILQTAVPMTAATSVQLEQGGVAILDMIDRHTWIASVTVSSAEYLTTHPDIWWSEVYPPEAKHGRELVLSAPYPWQVRTGGRAAFDVTFHRDVTTSVAADLLGGLEGVDLEIFEQDSFPVFRMATIVMEPDRVEEIAALDSVFAITPSEEPAEPNVQTNVQHLSRVDQAQTRHSLTGAGIRVGVWEAEDGDDAHLIRRSHDNLEPRVQNGSDYSARTSQESDHATFVAGVIASNGLSLGTSETEGMAPQARLVSFSSHEDHNEMWRASRSSSPIQISNHSYSMSYGWRGSGEFARPSPRGQSLFGTYSRKASLFDQLIARTDLIVTVSAGNERDDLGPPADWVAGADCNQDGFRHNNQEFDATCVGGRASAKNVITVGAMDRYGEIADFSSFGPTADGRIKPDIMAVGEEVISLGADDDQHIYSSSGTSFSAPAVAGVAALILEAADRLANLDIKAAGMKAVLLQTAIDVTSGQAQIGPDYASGYGLVDALAAIELLNLPTGPGLIQSEQGSSVSPVVDTGTMHAQSFRFCVGPDTDTLRVTLAWTDPAGNFATSARPRPRSVQLRNRQLRNDLDLRLQGPPTAQNPSPSPHEPWVLDPSAPWEAARRGNDNRNNVEQVSVDSPDEGVWTAIVSARTLLPGAVQDFALAGPISWTPNSHGDCRN